jgi:hypothetical protein
VRTTAPALPSLMLQIVAVNATKSTRCSDSVMMRVSLPAMPPLAPRQSTPRLDVLLAATRYFKLSLGTCVRLCHESRNLLLGLSFDLFWLPSIRVRLPGCVALMALINSRVVLVERPCHRQRLEVVLVWIKFDNIDFSLPSLRDKVQILALSSTERVPNCPS